jgi:hypothetical protein
MSTNPITQHPYWVQRNGVEPDYPDIWRTLSSHPTPEDAERERAFVAASLSAGAEVRVIHVPRYDTVEEYRAAKLAQECDEMHALADAMVAQFRAAS